MRRSKLRLYKNRQDRARPENLMPTRSMTGFAQIRGQVTDPRTDAQGKNQLGFTLSLKSVNHRFLDVFGQPRWRVIRGGSRRYVERLTASFRDRIRVSTPVTSVRRARDHVLVSHRGGSAERTKRSRDWWPHRS